MWILHLIYMNTSGLLALWSSNRIWGSLLRRNLIWNLSATPLTLIYIGNGCESYSTNIYIPSKTNLASEIDTFSRHDFFVSFNVICQNIIQYGIWNELRLETLTLEQKYLVGVKLSEFPPMTLDHLGKKIKNIRTSYPWSIPPNAILISLVSYALVYCVALVFSLW